MKRLILSVFSLLIVSISTVFAAIPDSEFAIGGGVSRVLCKSIQ